jgi:hypothetical protein
LNAAEVIKGCGKQFDLTPLIRGVRKVRWARQGRGKSGGVRVIYFIRGKPEEIWLLTLYAKSVSAVNPAHLLKTMKEELLNETD